MAFSRLQIQNKNIEYGIKIQLTFNSIFFLVCGFLQPIWYRNDDLVIAFLSKGINLSDKSIYTTYDTNIFLNYLYAKFPNILNIMSYSIIQFVLMFISMNIILSLMLRNSERKVYFLIAFTMVTIPTLLNPTFTITAGWVAIASLMFCKNAIQENKDWKLITGALLLIVSSLIRDEVTLIVFLVFLFSLFINKENLKFDRIKMSIIGITLLTLFATQFINRSVYKNDQFQFGQDFAKNISYPINDYGADLLLENNPQLIDKYGYSINDIKLMRNYFNVDKNLIDPNKVSKLLNEVGWKSAFLHINKERTEDQLRGILDKNIYGFYTLLFLLILLFRNTSNSRKFFVVAVFILIIMILRGRIEGFVTFLIVLSCVLFQRNKFEIKGKISSLIALAILSGLTLYTINLHFHKIEDSKVARESFNKLVVKDFWNWGGSFPTQLIYPVFDSKNWRKELRIKDMGWSTYIPETNSYKSLNDAGFIGELNSVNGVNFSAINFHLPLLERYCFEHFGSKLQLLITVDHPFITLYNAKCTSEIINLVSENLEFTDESSFVWFTNDNKEVTVRNASGQQLTGNINFSLREGPCKNDINNAEIIFQSKQIIITGNQELYSLAVSLDPFQSETLEIKIYGSEFCQIEGDARKLHSQLTNFSFEKRSS
jgi:predicted nuclease of restriction endonuclease-like (RecB) superfamily